MGKVKTIVGFLVIATLFYVGWNLAVMSGSDSSTASILSGAPPEFCTTKLNATRSPCLAVPKSWLGA